MKLFIVKLIWLQLKPKWQSKLKPKWNEAKKVFVHSLMATLYALCQKAHWELHKSNCFRHFGVLMKSHEKCHSEREVNCLKMLFNPSIWRRHTKAPFPGHRNACNPFACIFSASKCYKLSKMPKTNAITSRPVDNPNFDLSFDVMGKWMFKVAAKIRKESPPHLYTVWMEHNFLKCLM